MTRNRVGFTLLDVLVGMTVAAVVMSGAVTLLLGLSDASTRVHHAAHGRDAQMHGERLLRAVVGAVGFTDDGAPPIAGTTRGFRAHSSCETPAGELVRCRVEARLAIREPGVIVVIRTPYGQHEWASQGTDVELLYLMEAVGGGSWLDHWPGGDPPLAVGLRWGADTLLFPVRFDG